MAGIGVSDIATASSLEPTHNAKDGDHSQITMSPYAAVQASSDPAAMLTDFLASTYDIAADLAHWDRPALEREPVAP